MRANKSFTANLATGLLMASGLMLGSLAATEASAQCSSGCAPPPPPSKPHNPSKPYMPQVNASASAFASANATASASASSGASGSVFYGGGYGNWSQAQGIPVVVPGLNVEGASMAESYQASRSLTKQVTIQALCIDDKGVPHPASQVRGDKNVADVYIGELYRCIAGTRLQYTFDGKSYDCGKSDALWHEGGKVECRRQMAARACNERSLLRRFGAGVKVLTLTTTETYMATRQSEKKSSHSSMVFDGGVGGFVQ